MVKENVGVPALVVTPDKAPVISGNFGQIEKYLQGWKKKVSAIKISEDNMEEVRIIKKEAVQFRNSLADIQTRIKRLYFNDPKAVLDSNFEKLLSIIREVEASADSVLAKEEEERVAMVNKVLDRFIERFQEEYKLSPSFLNRIEHKKSYYNKTADEKERKDDLEGQFKALRKEENAYLGNVKLIRAACKDNPLLDVERYINYLDAEDVATILDEIEGEKVRLSNIGSTESTASSIAPDEEEETTNSKKTILGITDGIDFSTDFPGKNRVIKIQITYPVDVGDALTELFNGLKAHGIKIKMLKEEAVF